MGALLRAGEPVLRVHAVDRAQAEAACRAVLAAITVADAGPVVGPVVLETLVLETPTGNGPQP